MSARKQRNLIFIGLAIVLVVLMVAGYMTHSCDRSHSLDRGYQQIKIGDTEERVLSLMGKPDREVLPSDDRLWSSSILPHARPENREELGECVKEYRYEIRMWPEIWVVGFDAQGRVVCRNHSVA